MGIPFSESGAGRGRDVPASVRSRRHCYMDQVGAAAVVRGNVGSHVSSIFGEHHFVANICSSAARWRANSSSTSKPRQIKSPQRSNTSMWKLTTSIPGTKKDFKMALCTVMSWNPNKFRFQVPNSCLAVKCSVFELSCEIQTKIFQREPNDKVALLRF